MGGLWCLAAAFSEVLLPGIISNNDMELVLSLKELKVVHGAMMQVVRRFVL